MKTRLMMLSAALFAIVATSCHRQTLEEQFYTKALIPVFIDWSTGALLDANDDPDGDLYSASVWLFPTEESAYQGSPMEYKMADAELEYIEVPVGVYDVLIFNKTTGDYTSNVGFRGTDSFDSFEYYVQANNSLSLFSPTRDDDSSPVSLEPDLLAAWSSDSGEQLVVTNEMIGYYENVVENRSRTKATKALSKAGDVSSKVTVDDFNDLDEALRQLTTVVPERLTHSVTVTANVTNVSSATAAQGSLIGMSSSVFLAKRQYSSETTTHIVTFLNRVYTSDNNRDGQISGSFNIVGPLYADGEDYDFETLFTLVDSYDGSTTYPTPPASPFTDDITSQVKSATANIGLDKHLDILLPTTYALPSITIEGEGGFNVDVDEWGEPEIIPIM